MAVKDEIHRWKRVIEEPVRVDVREERIAHARRWKSDLEGSLREEENALGEVLGDSLMEEISAPAETERCRSIRGLEYVGLTFDLCLRSPESEGI